MKIVWTEFAMSCVKEIYDYQLGEDSYSRAKKIRNEIRKTPKVLTDHPAIGQVEEYLEALNLDHRYLLSGNYKLIYRIKEDTIYITDVFDTRQDPEKLKKRN